jgi:hypothetical protein
MADSEYKESDYIRDPKRNERDPRTDPVVDYTTEDLMDEGIILSPSALPRRSKASWEGRPNPRVIDVPPQTPKEEPGVPTNTESLDSSYQPRSDAKYREAVNLARAMLALREESSKTPLPEKVADSINEETGEIEGIPRDPRFHWTERDDVAAGAAPTPRDPQHRVSEEVSPIEKPKGDASHRAKPQRFRGGKTPPQG